MAALTQAETCPKQAGKLDGTLPGKWKPDLRRSVHSPEVEEVEVRS